MLNIVEEAVKSGIINLTDVAYELEQMNRQKILSQYHIWQGKNGSWYTKVDGRLIRKSTLIKLEDAIVNMHEKKCPTTVRSVYNDFIAFRQKQLKESTIIRYDSVFNTYFSAMADLDIRQMTAWDIEIFIMDIIDNGVTAKEYGNMRTILFGIFKMAKKMNLVDFRVSEVLEDMNISPKFFKRREAKKEVLDNVEYDKTIEYLSANQDHINMGLLLILITGLRIGELCGLRNSCIHIKEGFIEVSATEIRTKSGYVIADTTKTETSKRKIYVSPKYNWVLKKLKSFNPFGEYTFETSEGFIKSYTFRKRLWEICEILNIERIGPHKLRKTYASRLLQNGADKSLIISQMGHTDFTTTLRHYIKDIDTEEEKRLEIQRVT